MTRFPLGNLFHQIMPHASTFQFLDFDRGHFAFKDLLICFVSVNVKLTSSRYSRKISPFGDGKREAHDFDFNGSNIQHTIWC